MNIGPKTVTSFHYTLRDESGTEVETSRGSDPSAYLHGANNIIAGLEKAMEGHTSGDVFSTTLAAEDAYGQPDPKRLQRVPAKHLVFNGKLKAGMVVKLNTSEGQIPVTVVKAGRHSADIDTNHPLAGQTLTFDVEIMDVRAATEEEVAHGHAHGVGGHQHG